MSDKHFLFQKDTGEWIFGPTINSVMPSGLLRLARVSDNNIELRWMYNRDIAYRFGELTHASFFKETGDTYGSLAEFLQATIGFFSDLNPVSSNEMFAGRLGSHGEITDLTAAFKLAPELPFSICVVPKQATTDTLLIVSLKLYQDSVASDFPVPLGDWTPGGIIEIPAGSIDLGTYYVYWACGTKAGEAQ
jgi:hypothetical protein